MLGFYPIADAPLAAGQWSEDVTLASQVVVLTLNGVSISTDQTVTLSSQTLALSQNSVLVSDDDVIEVAGQVLELTLNGVSLSTDVNATLASQSLAFTENNVQIEVQPPAFDSQTIALTLNDVAISAAVTAYIDSQSFALSENSVDIANGHNIAVSGEIPMLSTLNSVGLSLDAVLVAASQPLNFTLNSVSLITDQSIVAQSQTIYTTLNRLREWIPINPVQPGSCTDGIDGQWTDIPFDTEIYGDDFAIAAEPIGCLPQPLPPYRKFPGTPWTNVPTQTTTSWSNIQT